MNAGLVLPARNSLVALPLEQEEAAETALTLVPHAVVLTAHTDCAVLRGALRHPLQDLGGEGGNTEGGRGMRTSSEVSHTTQTQRFRRLVEGTRQSGGTEKKKHKETRLYTSPPRVTRVLYTRSLYIYI